MHYYTTTYVSPVGIFTLACNGDQLVGLWIEGQKYFGESIPEKTTPNHNLPVFMRLSIGWIRYFAGEKPVASNCRCAQSAVTSSGSMADFMRNTVWSSDNLWRYRKATSHQQRKRIDVQPSCGRRCRA